MARKKQTKQRKQVKRQTRKFQLRIENPIDQHVAEILDYKRSQRSEVTTIRDSVRLFWALENNDLELLFEMFPQYRAKFTSGGDGAGGSDLAKQIAEQIVLMNATPGYLMQSAQPSPALAAPQSSTGKQIAGFKPLAGPTEDDNDLPEIQTKGQAQSAMDNFLNMMGSLNNVAPKAVAQKAKEASADEIADNFLNAFV